MSDTSETRVHVMVEGRVQGVFFRSSVEDRAGELGVTGWVRNVPDGWVEAEFQGEQSAVDQLLDFCRDGPSRADVENVTVDTVDPVEGEQGFTVRQ